MFEFQFREKIEVKLLILYILHQAKATAKREYLEKQFLFDFAITNTTVNYFDLQICMSELIDDEIIIKSVKRHKDILYLTTKGAEMVGYFAYEIPMSVRDDIDKAICESWKKYRDDETVVVDYWMDNEHSHTATFKIFEDDMQNMQFSLTFTSAKPAQQLIRMFKKYPVEYYRQFIDLCSKAIERCEEEDKNKKPFDD